MARPIKKKYFGNTIRPYQNQASGGNTGVGGEGVASVTFSNSGTLYSQGTTVSFGAPNVAGGIRATGTPVIDTAGLLRGVTFTERGTGYTSAPTLTVTTSTGVASASTGTSGQSIIYPASTTGLYVGMKVIGANISASSTFITSVVGTAVNLTWPNAGTVGSSINFVDAGSAQANTVALYATTTSQDAIAITSYLTTGSSAVSGGDIIKQESSRRYLVRNSQGVGQVRIGAGTGDGHVLVAGQAHITATDGGGATYYVTKLTAHKATLINRTNTSTALVANLVAGWTLGVATGTNQVSISKNA
jgi:hypothetical protein